MPHCVPVPVRILAHAAQHSHDPLRDVTLTAVPAVSGKLSARLPVIAWLALGIGLLAYCRPAWADATGGSTILLQTTVYTVHFNPSPDHVNHQDLIGIEVERPDHWLFGFGAFRNSFGQPAQYLYGGKRFHLIGHNPELYAKLTAGLLHGYKGEYKDKIPFNHLGVAPAILPALGIQLDRFDAELVLFGLAGMTLTVGVSF